MTNTDRGAAPPNPAAAACNAPTKNAALRERIAELVLLGRVNDIDGFVAKFVPRDCDDEDVSEFSKSLHEDAERWALLRSEIERVDAGSRPSCGPHRDARGQVGGHVSAVPRWRS